MRKKMMKKKRNTNLEPCKTSVEKLLGKLLAFLYGGLLLNVVFVFL
jgi:hypothetical protein